MSDDKLSDVIEALKISGRPRRHVSDAHRTGRKNPFRTRTFSDPGAPSSCLSKSELPPITPPKNTRCQVLRKIKRNPVLRESVLKLSRNYDVCRVTEGKFSQSQARVTKTDENVSKSRVKPTELATSAESATPSSPPRGKTEEGSPTSCAAQAWRTADCDDTTIDDLTGYLDHMLHLPKPMSSMAEMMYT